MILLFLICVLTHCVNQYVFDTHIPAGCFLRKSIGVTAVIIGFCTGQRIRFGAALIPYLSAAFAEVRYERGEPYDLTLIGTYRPDVVLIVLAERNLPSLSADLAAVAP